MILAETQYKTHDGELLVLVEAFKNWQHYLENCKYEVLMLTNYKNFGWFIDTKNICSRQVCWAKNLFQYYF